MNLYDHHRGIDDPQATSQPWVPRNSDTHRKTALTPVSVLLNSGTPTVHTESTDAIVLDDPAQDHRDKLRPFSFEFERSNNSPPGLQGQSTESSSQIRWISTGFETVTSNPVLAPFISEDSVLSSRIYLEKPVWPLQKRDEAMLLRHFIENLARNFDLTDPQQHFRLVVPQRAGTCPTLLNAIFALSARHLSRIAGLDPLISNRCQQDCLQHLIPMLDDNAAILDENLLASTIILRNLEEFEFLVSGEQRSEQRSHLLGTQAFISAQERATLTGGLRQAAFWIGLRQEVYIAFIHQRPIIPVLEHCNIDRSFGPAEEHVWSYCIIVLCADILRYCFGNRPQSTSTYHFLTESMPQWDRQRPASFNPIYTRAAALATAGDGETDNDTDAETDDGDETYDQVPDIFPELWYVNDITTTGVQHYHLARTLLSAHDPGIPRLGPGRRAALAAMDDEIRAHVLVLCGICQGHVTSTPSFAYASLAVTMAGEKFGTRRAQAALLAVLEQCDRQHAWPTREAQRNLKIAWGWKNVDNRETQSL